MPAISFSGETSQGPFYTQILEGHKWQTCRQPRRIPIEEGDFLMLYWKMRQPEKSKPIHLIGYAKCTSVKRMKYKDFAFDEAFARRDGFADSAELRQWFGDPSIHGEEEYDVIRFMLTGAGRT